MILLNGAKVFNGEQFLQNHSVLLDGAHIVAIEEVATLQAQLQKQGIRPIQQNLAGGLLAPGFIDTQVNGGGGALFNHDISLNTLTTMMQTHRRYGTTGMYPTLMTDTQDAILQAISTVSTALEEGMTGILGIHLEGPYLNTEKSGVHRASVIRPFDKELMKILRHPLPNHIHGAAKVILTLAPEQQPTGLIQQLTDVGIRVCAGHSNATYEQVQQALSEGLAGFTHLYNAMSALQSREPGMVGAALDDPYSYCGIIADGYHVHPSVLAISIAAKAPQRIILVTDAMHTVGIPDGQYTLFNDSIYSNNGRVIMGNGTLAGSNLTMIDAVRNCHEKVGICLEESLRMASLYPATFLGLAHKLGRVQAGYAADLIHIDDDWQVTHSWIAGQMLQYQ